jgi:uncharacterized protein YqgC (DUF456 family)
MIPLVDGPEILLVELFGFEGLGLVAVALLVLGVVGSAIPAVPGASLSIAGLLLHWWHTRFTEPGALALLVLLSLAALALAADWFGGPLAAKAGGASTRTTLVAAVVGFLLLFVAGPLGILLGVAGTVFAFEYRRSGDVRGSLRSAGYVTVGILASAVVQVLLTGAVLVGFLIAV